MLQKVVGLVHKPKISGKLYLETVTLDTLGVSAKKALEKLDASLFFKESRAYLAGGSGLTLHLGHRYSYDLDFFTRKKFQEDAIIQLIDQCGHFKLESRYWRTILGIFEDVKFSLFFYKYPLIKPTIKILKSINLVSLEDIAAMKIAAISDRGTKRDFIDLYFLLAHFSLEKILKLYDQKYQNLAANRVHILKSLVYFADAERESMPEMIKDINWQDLKTLIMEKVKGLAP